MIFKLKICFIAIIFIMLCGCSNSEKISPPKAINGVLDLTNWDLEKNGSLELNGQWEFYDKQILFPNDFIKQKPFDYLDINKKLNSFKFNGFATYRLNILNPSKNIVALTFKYKNDIDYKLFVNNELVKFNGNPKGTKSLNKPTKLEMYFSESYKFSTNNEPISIILQVESEKINIFGVITFQTDNELVITNNNDIYLESFGYGILIIVGLYHLILFLFRRKDISNLYIFILCIITLFTFINFNGVPRFHAEASSRYTLPKAG